MKRSVNVFAYRFSKGAGLHGVNLALEDGYSHLRRFFLGCGIDFEWTEVVPKIHRKSYQSDEQGSKPGTIKNVRAVVETVGSLAGKVAREMLSEHTLPLTFGGDHTQGLGTNKGLILAEVTQALLSGTLVLQHPEGSGSNDVRLFMRLRNAIARKDMKDLAAEVTLLITRGHLTVSALEQFLARFHVVWFDAHGDYNTKETSPSGNAHGMIAAAITGVGDSQLTDIIGSWAKIRPQNLHFIAIRDLDEEEYQLMLSAGVNIHDMEEINAEGLKAVVAKTLAGIEASTLTETGELPKVHLSFDIDGIDARYVPATGTPVGEGSRRNQQKGPSLAETVDAFAGIACKVVAIDISEANFQAKLDPHGITLQTVNRLIPAFFGVTTDKAVNAKQAATQKAVFMTGGGREKARKRK
jgi:arginase